MSILLLATIGAHAEPPTADEARELLGEPVDVAVAKFQAWDAVYNNGLGNSSATTSGGLGWGEAGFLRNYMSCYYATQDPYWLDKVVDHFDRMLASQTDRNGDGFLAWDDIRYSVGIVTVTGSEQADGLTLEPTEQRENVTRNGEAVTGHTYRLEFPAADQLRVVDVTTGQEAMPPTAYTGEATIDIFQGQTYAGVKQARAGKSAAPLVLKGPGRAGASFTIETTAPEWIEFVVHDGMITYPIAQWLECVYGDPALQAKYGEKAAEWVAWLDRNVRERWSRFWMQVDDQAGAYTFTDRVTERYPNYLLPHNQFLALGRTYLVLQAIEGIPHQDEYRAKATAMATYFQRYLKPALDGRAYVWNYWDPPASQPLKPHVEDHSHATIDVGFVVEAARRGIVFTADDVVKIARTWTDVMSNGDPAAPRIAGRVDGTGEKKNGTWFDWATTALEDRQALQQFATMVGVAVSSRPQFCELVARLGGVTEAERAAARQHTAALLQQLAALQDGNLGFELGLDGQLLGWSLDRWSAQAGDGHSDWSTEAHSGEHSLAMTGTEGSPNLVARVPLADPRAGETITLACWYKTAGSPKPYCSLIAALPDGRQYDSSPTFEPSETWRQATWTVTVKPGAKDVALYLRNGGVGSVWFDDIELDRK